MGKIVLDFEQISFSNNLLERIMFENRGLTVLVNGETKQSYWCRVRSNFKPQEYILAFKFYFLRQKKKKKHNKTQKCNISLAIST